MVDEKEIIKKNLQSLYNDLIQAESGPDRNTFGFKHRLEVIFENLAELEPRIVVEYPEFGEFNALNTFDSEYHSRGDSGMAQFLKSRIKNIAIRIGQDLEGKNQTSSIKISKTKKKETPIRVSEPDSTSSGLHITKKVKGILATIGGAGIIAIIFFIVSMPNMEVSMYIPDNTIAQYDNKWNTIDVKLELEQKDNRFNDWTNTCFRISNTANYIESVPIGANNLKTDIKTNAICKECNSRLNHDFLRAQEHVDDCESLQIEKDVENFDFFINLEYNTFLPFTNEFKYGCQYVGMTEETRFADADYLFNCDLEYKKWKIAFDKLFKI